MAIYHFSAKVISRGKGQSSIATAAYNAREKLIDERTGEVKDYSHKEGLIFSGIFTPKDAPEWAQNRAELWNKAEEAEKRKDSTIARNYTVALPHELNDQQQRYLIQDFIKENFTRKGYAADLCIHAPDKDGDNRNHHAHILVTDRRLEAEGFAPSKSERQLKSNERKAELETLRESWEKHGNRHLERHGFEPTLDRRTLEAQGIDREPTQHLGAKVSALENKGIETDRGDQARQIDARNSELESLKREAEKIAREIIAEQQQQLREHLTATSNGKNKQTMNPDNEQEQKKRGVSGYDKGGMVAQQAEALREHAERVRLAKQQFEERKIESEKTDPEKAKILDQWGDHEKQHKIEQYKARQEAGIIDSVRDKEATELIKAAELEKQRHAPELSERDKEKLRLAEMKQNERLKMEEREVKTEVSALYQQAQGNGKEFVKELNAKGYELAKDPQKNLVVVDERGGVHNLKTVSGTMGVEIKQTLHEYPLENLKEAKAVSLEHSLNWQETRREAFKNNEAENFIQREDKLLKARENTPIEKERQTELAKTQKQPDQNTERVKYTEDYETRQRQNEADKNRDTQKSVDYAATRGNALPSQLNGKELTDTQRARLERAAKLREGMQRERGDHDREYSGGRERTRER